MKFAIAIKKSMVYGVLACAVALTLSNVSPAQRQVPVELLFERGQLPRGLVNSQPGAVHDGDTGGVVSAVLETPKAFDQ